MPGEMQHDESACRLHAIIRGQVQGVNFRAYTRREAISLGLTGWVRNRADYSVETAAEGPQEALEQFLAFLHQGPPLAVVASVDSQWLNAIGEFSDFTIAF